MPIGIAQAADGHDSPNDLSGAVQGTAAARSAQSADRPSKVREGAPTLEAAITAFKAARIAKSASGPAKDAVGPSALGEAVAKSEATLEAALHTSAPLPSAVAPVSRVSGNNRYHTAALLSMVANEGYRSYNDGESVPFVFVATGSNYPDALAAGAWQIPILLTQPTYVPPETMAALADIDPYYIFVLGGPGVVSPEVEDDLYWNTNALAVERFNGANRYDTAAQVNAFFSVQGATVYLATGQDFPDALGAGPPAGYELASILLARQDSLPTETSSALQFAAPDQVVLQGGTGALSEAVRVQAGNYATQGAIRRAGADRYSTAVESGRSVFDSSNTYAVFLATGTNYPDALASGPAAYWWDGPVLLMKPNCIPAVVNDRLSELQPIELLAVGGTGAIADGAWDRIC